MKDLILAFEEQCWVNAGDEHQYFDSEKFAGLIVQDCIAIMEHARDNKMRLGDAIWNTKQHFGV